MSGPASSQHPDYRLAAAGRESDEDARLDLLEQIYDPVTQRRRSFVQPGWRCLEVGAGRGSMARWMADQVGPTGSVVATDIDIRYLSRLDIPNLEVVRHSILDDPLEALGGAGSFDLVCSRLMLFHLKNIQERAIARMVECLRPGGVLFDEDCAWGTAAPVDPAHPRYDEYHRIWRDGEWWTDRGYDKAFGQKLPAIFERCGLEDIRTEASTEVIRGGSPWARWWIPTLEVINELGGGDEETRRGVAVMAEGLADPTMWLQREVVYACWGTRAS